MISFLKIIFKIYKIKAVVFDARSFYSKVLERINSASSVGRERIAKEKKKLVWPTDEMFILLDHLVKNSKIADYRILSSVVPYKVMRAVYIKILRSYEESKKESK